MSLLKYMLSGFLAIGLNMGLFYKALPRLQITWLVGAKGLLDR
jgi:hypothetical protein